MPERLRWLWGELVGIRVTVLRFGLVFFFFQPAERQYNIEFLILLLEFEVSHRCFCNCWASGSCP